MNLSFFVKELFVTYLVARQQLTNAGKRAAQSYQIDDIVSFSRGSKVNSISRGDYGRVRARDISNNLITVELLNGENRTYNPEQVASVNVYREEARSFAKGDRIQFRQPLRERSVANGELGIIEKVDQAGNLTVLTDRGKEIKFNLNDWRHIDLGYAVTSYSSQSETSYRALINIDTSLPDTMVNRRMAYVAISRASHEAKIYTDNEAALTRSLSRPYDKNTAIETVWQRDNDLLKIYQQGLSIFNDISIPLAQQEQLLAERLYRLQAIEQQSTYHSARELLNDHNELATEYRSLAKEEVSRNGELDWHELDTKIAVKMLESGRTTDQIETVLEISSPGPIIAMENGGSSEIYIAEVVSNSKSIFEEINVSAKFDFNIQQ